MFIEAYIMIFVRLIALVFLCKVSMDGALNVSRYDLKKLGSL